MSEGTEVVVVHEPSYVDVIEENVTVEVAQENYTVEVYGAVGVPGPQGSRGPKGDTGAGLPITWMKKGPLALVSDSARYRFPYNVTIVGISATMGADTPPVGSSIIVDIYIENTVVHTLIIPDGSVDVDEIPLSINADAGDHLYPVVTQVGSVEPGSNFAMFIRYDERGA